MKERECVCVVLFIIIFSKTQRFSGIKAEDLQASDKVVDLSKAREMMAGFMTPSTILVGHGLENDLKALRLIHVNVADSALIYKHHKGLPFRISLRELTLKHLGKQIQTGDATFGHDPEEDARAALEYVDCLIPPRAKLDRSTDNSPPPRRPLLPLAVLFDVNTWKCPTDRHYFHHLHRTRMYP